jgi:RNA polymerase-binding transcription factor DksA
MATKKKAAKPAAKKPVKSVKKAAPAKKVAPKKTIPVKKASPKKVAPKKVAVKKAVVKKVVKSAPAAPKKPAPKVVVKKTVKIVKSAPKKAVAANKAVKPVVKVAAKQTVIKPMNKKIEVKKAVEKPVSVKKAPAKVAVREKAPEKAKDIKIAPAKAVVLPKINTKTSRKYQPEFTKSVLDQPKHDLGAPIVRYSDADLNEFREIIQRKLDSAKKELSYLQGLITRKDEMGGDNDDARYMTMEDGSMSMEREQLSQMASRQITFIDHLEKAVMRIENKTYGICRVTGQLIDKARLRAVPHATLSIEAKMGAAK